MVYSIQFITSQSGFGGVNYLVQLLGSAATSGVETYS